MNSLGTLFGRQFKDQRWALLMYVLAGVAFLWIMVAVYPSISKEADQFNQLMKNLPASFLKAFDVQDNALSTFEGFVALRYFAIVWPIMLILLAISLASRSPAGDIDRGTIELLLARPVSRLKLFASRWLFGAFGVLGFTGLSILAVVPLAKLYGVALQFDRYLLLLVIAGFFGLALYALALMVSSIASNPGKVSMMIGGLLVVMYFLNILALIKDSLDTLKYLSFFYYFDYQGALNDGAINGTSVAVFSGVIIVSTVVGAVAWKKRDVSA
jgi:ABC-2 type transport system permease protein